MVAYAGGMMTWQEEYKFDYAADGGNWRVALPPALETEVGTICPHLGLLFQHTAVVLCSIVRRLARQGNCDVNHRDTRRSLLRLTHLLHMAPDERGKLLLDVCHGLST